MSHLRQQISALVDGELTGAELDKANAHLAACARCRSEAAALRELKRELHALAAMPFDSPTDVGPDDARSQGAPGADEELTRRLLAMANQGGPAPSRRSRREQSRRKRREQRGGRPGSAPGGTGAQAGLRAARRPYGDVQAIYGGRLPRGPHRRGRYVVWSAVSLVVVGIGTAAFTMGGGGANPTPGPKITPQLEMQMFSLEHAVTSGDVPAFDPTQAPTATPLCTRCRYCDVRGCC